MTARKYAVALAVAACTLWSLLGTAQTMGSPERYRANAVNLDVGAAGLIDITVERWSTPAERDNLRWELRFAWKTPQPDGGERVVLATDRPISFREAAHQSRTLDYPFTVIELRLKKDGEGEGKMSLATKIIPDKEANTVTLENWGTQPVTLKLVHREKLSQ